MAAHLRLIKCNPSNDPPTPKETIKQPTPKRIYFGSYARRMRCYDQTKLAQLRQSKEGDHPHDNQN